jgi:hypothetical protein
VWSEYPIIKSGYLSAKLTILLRLACSKGVGYSRTQIWRWKKEKNFIAEWEKRKLEISEFLDRSSKKKFEKLQDTAIEVLENLLKTSNNDNVKKETAQYIIERNIGKIPNKTEIKDTTGDTDNDGNVIDSIPDWEQGNKE